MGIPDDLETTSVDVKRSPLKRERLFSFDATFKLRRSSELVIKYRYHIRQVCLVISKSNNK